ncbi:MAG: glycosyltransferase [Candidatus Eiseniibacteriota bacterium]
MSRVLHVTASGEGGGAVHLTMLLPALRRLGITSEAAVEERGPLAGRLRSLGFTVHPLDLFRSRFDATAPFRLASIVRRSNPDVIHYHGTRAAFFGACARLLLRHRPATLYTVHGLSYRKESNRISRAVFLFAELLACRGADLVISVSQVDLQDLAQRGLLGRTPGRHIPNAVDGERFSPGDRGAARVRLGLPRDAFIVGTVSRLVPQKSVIDLIHAAVRLPAAFVVIVGDGPERPLLEQAARPLGERILFLGHRDDVAELLRAFDVFVLCSRWEGEPLVLLEAMATAIPWVSAANTAAREILESGGGGLIVPVGEPDELARVLAELAGAPESRSAIGETGRRAVQGRSADALARAVAEAYAVAT